MSIFGVWMWPESVRLSGADRVVSYCSRAGITDIFFLTKGLAGTVSYRSRIAPGCCDRDLLGELLSAAHAAGIRVHAWLTSASDEHYKSLHPESRRCHYTRGRDKALISLTDSGYLRYMEHVVRELCERYEIDGLHLDYIRYNHLLYGWSEEDLARYAAAGADVAHLRELMDKTFISEEERQSECIFDALRSGDKSVRALADTRRADVVHFASALIRAAREERSSLILSAALMPEGAYEDTAFADLHYGQNYEDAASLYDNVLPMAYSNAYDKDSLWVRSVAEGTIRRGMKTVMGLHAYDGGTGESLTDDVASLEDSDTAGVCFFRYGAFAMILQEKQGVCVVNTLSQPITEIQPCPSGESMILNPPVLPGEEQQIVLPFHPDSIRIFSGESELCAFLFKIT